MQKAEPFKVDIDEVAGEYHFIRYRRKIKVDPS